MALVLWSIWLGWRGSHKAIWLSGSGTVLTVLALLLTAGWNDTSYYPSLADMQSSLTIYNSSMTNCPQGHEYQAYRSAFHSSSPTSATLGGP
ncbi:MAG: hypothetical protein ACLVJK_02785 [Alistipes putredinis]